MALFRSTEDRRPERPASTRRASLPGSTTPTSGRCCRPAAPRSTSRHGICVFGLVRNRAALVRRLLASWASPRAGLRHPLRHPLDEAGHAVEGRALKAVARPGRPLDSVRFVIAHAEQGYTANLPIEAIRDQDVMIGLEADGAPLTPEHGYPARLVVPSATSGRARSGCAGSSSRTWTSPVSGKATDTTTRAIPGVRSGTASSGAVDLFCERLETLVDIDTPSDGVEQERVGELLAEWLAPLGTSRSGRRAGLSGAQRLHLSARRGRGVVALLGHGDTVFPLGTSAEWPFRRRGCAASAPASPT